MHFSFSFGTRDHSQTRFRSYHDPNHRYWALAWRWFVLTVGYYH